MKEKIKNRLFLLSIFFVLLFSMFVRIYWASGKEGLYWDELYSVGFSKNMPELFLNEEKSISGLTNYFNYDKEYTGKEIKSILLYSNSSVKQCLLDIASLYKDSKDPMISNLYYSLLRLSFIGREVIDYKNIIMTGALLNLVFFVISFIFLYKLLRLFILDRKVIVFSLFCISIMSSSINFTMFLRPYQMQEAFFIVLTYLICKIIISNRYSIKNFILLCFCCAFGYLTLYSSLIFVFCAGIFIFIYFSFTIDINDSFFSKKSKLNILFLFLSFIFAASIITLNILGANLRKEYLKPVGSEVTKEGKEIVKARIDYKSQIFRNSDIFYIKNLVIYTNDIENLDSYEIILEKAGMIDLVFANPVEDNEVRNIKAEYSLTINPKMFSYFFAAFILFLALKLSLSIKEIHFDKKRVLYFAASFILALFVCRVFYLSFLKNLFNASGRAGGSFSFPSHIFDYINSLAFANVLPIIMLAFFIFIFILYKNKRAIEVYCVYKERLKLFIFVICIFVLSAVLLDASAPFKLSRYSASAYTLVFLFVPLFVLMIKNIRVRNLFMIIISLFYLYSVTMMNNFEYFYKYPSDKVFIFNKNPEYTVYGIDNMMSFYDDIYLNDNQKYIMLKDYDELGSRLEEDRPYLFYLITKDDLNYVQNLKYFQNYKIKNSSTRKDPAAPLYYIIEFGLEK